tara:strand:- start:10647 stop:11444 length:798 start_codon:yes stop_codon:yes gene_type:complete
MNLHSLNKSLSDKQKIHISILKEKVFELHKYPSFQLLIEGLEEILINDDLIQNNICILERTKLYGSSLFGGLFEKANLISYDCSPASADERGSYNSHMIDSKNFLKFTKSESLNQDATFALPENKFDVIFIPNLVHHFEDQSLLFSVCYKSLKKNGKLIVFEPTFREIHQAPHDYIRYTPYGIKQILIQNSFCKINCKETGDSFEALSYILNIMKAKRDDKDFIDWCNTLDEKINQFKKGKVDIVKNHARFPTAFICEGIKHDSK